MHAYVLFCLCLRGWSNLRRSYRVFISWSADLAVNLASWRHCDAIQPYESSVVIWVDSSHQARTGSGIDVFNMYISQWTTSVQCKARVGLHYGAVVARLPAWCLPACSDNEPPVLLDVEFLQGVSSLLCRTLH